MSYRFHLPDFARHFKLNIMIADHIKKASETVMDGAEIGSVYGIFPNMIFQ